MNRIILKIEGTGKALRTFSTTNMAIGMRVLSAMLVEAGIKNPAAEVEDVSIDKYCRITTVKVDDQVTRVLYEGRGDEGDLLAQAQKLRRQQISKLVSFLAWLVCIVGALIGMVIIISSLI